jgi:hypothetical protein
MGSELKIAAFNGMYWKKKVATKPSLKPAEMALMVKV